MTEAEARARVRELTTTATRPGGWMARPAQGGAWEVVRVTAPGLDGRGPTGAHTESRPRPEEPEDPRPSAFRAVPPYGAG